MGVSLLLNGVATWPSIISNEICYSLRLYHKWLSYYQKPKV